MEDNDTLIFQANSGRIAVVKFLKKGKNIGVECNWLSPDYTEQDRTELTDHVLKLIPNSNLLESRNIISKAKSQKQLKEFIKTGKLPKEIVN